MPQLYMIGGPHGAGKTTTAFQLFSSSFCPEYINADVIAAGLSRFSPEENAIKAGRSLLEQIHSCAQNKKDFAFETTMASRTFVHFLKKCQQLDYEIHLIFVWLQTVAYAVQRVEQRVLNGGHAIAKEDILRRYSRSINNFLNLYKPLADSWVVYDNTFDHPKMIAFQKAKECISIIDPMLWDKFKQNGELNGRK